MDSQNHHIQAGRETPAATESGAVFSKTTSRDRARTRHDGSGETVLLVEDDAPVRSLVSVALRRHGYHVIEAANGVQALEIWEKHRDAIKLLLTDLIMPGGVGGQDLASRCQRDKPALKVIFTSGYSIETEVPQTHVPPEESFLQKPFSPVELLQAIRQSLDS